MLELRHRGGCPGPGGAGTPPPREGEAAGGDHETESTSDKVSERESEAGPGPRPRSGRAGRGGPACPPGRARPGLPHLNLCTLDSSLTPHPNPAQGPGWNPSPRALR